MGFARRMPHRGVTLASVTHPPQSNRWGVSIAIGHDLHVRPERAQSEWTIEESSLRKPNGRAPCTWHAARWSRHFPTPVVPTRFPAAITQESRRSSMKKVWLGVFAALAMATTACSSSSGGGTTCPAGQIAVTINGSTQCYSTDGGLDTGGGGDTAGGGDTGHPTTDSGHHDV